MLRGAGFWGAGFGGIVVACAAAVPTISSADPATVQCWTDDHGQRACGDHVPPQYAKAERQLVDQHGVVIKVVPRERTPAEQAEFLHQQELDRQAQAAARQQVAYDDFLRQAYSSVADIEKTRDERLSIIDGRLQLAEKSQTSTVATLDELNHRVAVLQAAKQPTPDDLAKSVRSFQAARTSNDEAIAKLRQTRVQTADQFGRDIARYRSLRGLPPS